MSRIRRVLIVGAKFGEIYLNSFLKEQPGLELCGLLAKGSPRALQLAKAYGIPLYTSLDRVPHAVDIACIVVRSTVVGGEGSKIAEALLQRGAHVVQEHPVHPDEIERLQALAVRLGLTYWVNSFYANTLSGRCWISAARQIQSESGEVPSIAQLTTSRQLLYSSLDLISQAINRVPQEAEVTCPRKGELFDDFYLSFSDMSLSLKLQNYIDPTDPDQHSLIMHQCQLGWPNGYLALAASYGPVVWAPVFFDANHLSSSKSMYDRASSVEGACFLNQTAVTLHEAPRDWRTALERDGPEGVSFVLGSLVRSLNEGTTPSGFDPRYQLAVARLWQHCLQKAGPPRLCSLPAPRTIDTQRLLMTNAVELQS